MSSPNAQPRVHSIPGLPTLPTIPNIPGLPKIPSLPANVQQLADVIAKYSNASKPKIAKPSNPSGASGAAGAADSSGANDKAANIARYAKAGLPALVPVTVPASITLELSGTSQQTSTLLPIAPRSPGSPGRPPQPGKAQRKPQTLETITFDVATTKDGFAQTISYSFTARQSTHQTAGGYYVDEFGTAPGSLSIDVIALATDVGDLANRLSRLKSLLDEAKLSNPLSPAFPTVLRFLNAYDGCSFILTQTRIDFRYSADEPNRLAVSIGGDILQDYGTTPKRGTTGNIAAVTSRKADLVVVQDESILNYTA